MIHAKRALMVAMIVFGVGLGTSVQAQCCADCGGDGYVTVDDIVIAVNNSMNGCGPVPTPTAAATIVPRPASVPASGQVTAYGRGSDGDVRAGAALSYTDNGDGTITDNTTGLMWEKKDDSDGIHGKDRYFTWGLTSAPYTMDGTIVTEFLAELNAPPCFARFCDWRIPNVKELQTLVDYEVPLPGPTVDPAFHHPSGCAGCTDVTVPSCSCTAADRYWSSTTYRFDPQNAWNTTFSYGNVIFVFKSGTSAVRAVRGGGTAGR